MGYDGVQGSLIGGYATTTALLFPMLMFLLPSRFFC